MKPVFTPNQHDASCDTCPFWKPWNRQRYKAEVGSCRRNPPVGRYEEQIVTTSFRGHWPTTHDEDWCGEHPSMREALPGVWIDNPHDKGPAMLMSWPAKDDEVWPPPEEES